MDEDVGRECLCEKHDAGEEFTAEQWSMIDRLVEKPRRKHRIRVCLGTACHVSGGQRNMERVMRTLKIQPGESTEDRQFSLDIVRCLGACAPAPVMAVDGETHRQVREAGLDAILKRCRDGAMDSEG